MVLFNVCVILLLFLDISNSLSFSNNYYELNSRTKFAYRIQTLLDNTNNRDLSPQCHAHFQQFKKSLISGKEEDVWALQMYDAQSKIPAGLLDGNLADLGSFDECLNVEAHLPQSDDIFGKYCIGTIPVDIDNPRNANTNKLAPLLTPIYDVANFNTRASPGGALGIRWATCLPHSCSAVDMQRMYSALGIVFSEEQCQTKASQPALDGGAIAMISFLGLILWIILASTFYDVILHYYDKKPHHPLLITFSGLTNGKKMLSVSYSPNQITCLHGIRVISTMWVILGHRYNIQSTFPMRNYLHAFEWMNNQANMFIVGATVSVDTFFVMSGLVIAYSYMSAVTKGTKFNVVMYYIHRYIRLTPVLAVVILIHITLVRHLGSGPLWPQSVQQYLVGSCEQYWWKGLLYIQNYGGQGAPCVPQSWYLSVDTQLFLLSPLILIPLKKWPKITLSATGFLTVCSILTCFLLSWFLELEQRVLPDDPVKFKQYFQYYYYATYTRAGPWFIGIVLGYVVFIFKQRRTKIIINKVVIFFVWTTSLAVLCACVFAGHDLMFGKYDKVLTSLHLAFMRPGWAVALSCIIFLCVIEYGGPVNWFLSLPVFQILSKLTFTLYLSHYTIIYIITAQMRTTPRFSQVQMLYVFWGDLAYTVAVSLVLTLAFESPIITIEKFLFGKVKRNVTRPPQTEEEVPKTVESV